MKKVILIVVLGLLWCNTASALPRANEGELNKKKYIKVKIDNKSFFMLHDIKELKLSHVPVSRAVLWVNNLIERGLSEGVNLHI